ncbi:MAG: hypothetical protein HN683_04645 [Gammaproteobacteria bacterium]|jgi:hypothetical protein|nr:hypothetical protein [Gammaproteobacteria bacterium]
MALPKQVQEQSDQADAIQQHLYGDQTPTDASQPQVSVVTPEAEQSATPTPEVQAPETTVEAPVEPAPEKPSTTSTDDDPAVWKQKYKTLQGMYDAEVPRLHSQVKNLETQIETLNSQVTALTTQQEQAPTPQSVERTSLVTDEDRQEFGEDLIEVQRKVAREETADLTKRFEALEAENAMLKQQQGETENKVSTQSFEQRLARLVPDFEEINTNPSWIAWLNEVDPILRGPRMGAAQNAYAEGDAEAVAHYVQLFKDTEQPVDTPDPTPSKELESQIQPSTTSTAATTAPSVNGKIYNDAAVRKMFLKVMELNANGRTEEARKLEAEIDSAYTENRVKG